MTVDFIISVKNGYSLVYSFIFSLYVSIFIFLFVVTFYKYQLELLNRSIEIVLWFNLSFWFYQLVTLYLFGETIDPIGFLSGVPARMDSPPYLPIKLWRPSGLTWEPGTYATFMSLLLYSSYLITGRIKKLYIFVSLSFILSLSIFAAIFGIVFLMTILRQRLYKNKIILLLLLFILIYFSFYLLNDYVQARFFSENAKDNSLLIKQFAIEFWLNQDFYRQLWGSRFSHNDCNCLVRDSSLFFNMIYTFGISGLIIMLTFIKKISFDFASFIFIILIFSSKMMIFSPLIWFSFAVFTLVKNNQSPMVVLPKNNSSQK